MALIVKLHLQLNHTYNYIVLIVTPCAIIVLVIVALDRPLRELVLYFIYN